MIIPLSRIFTFLTILSIAALFVPPATAGERAPVPPADIREMTVPEPVFKGTAYLIEAGMEHDMSVVLVHGAGNRASGDWDLVIPELAKQYHVVAFDLPGFGRSSKKNLLYSPARYSLFIRWVVQRHVKGPFVLIGHSLGGALALRYAADFPDGLRGLVLADAAGILHRTALFKSLYLAGNSAIGSAQPSRKSEQTGEFLRFLLDDLSNDDWAKKLDSALQSGSLRSVLAGGETKRIASLAMMLEDFGQIVDQMRTPTLLIWGENDTISPLRTARALASRLPRARMLIIPASGHVPMQEQAETFNRIVIRGLASLQKKTEGRAGQQQSRQIAERIVRCEGKRGVVYTGKFKSIKLYRCSDVTIRDVTAERITAVSSDVVMENTRIYGTEAGLSAKRSEITATDIAIEADTAIEASHSHLDLAGAVLSGRKAAVATDSRSVFLFSISHSDSPCYSGPLHGIRKVTRRTAI